MPKPRKSEPDEIALIAWAIPQIAQGYYIVSDDAGSRELRVLERSLNLGEMEDSLLSCNSKTVASAMSQMRENCSFVNVQNFLGALFGKKFRQQFAQQFLEKPPEYDEVILAAYVQEKNLIRDVQRILVQGREGLSTAQLERVESAALPEAVFVAVVTHYAKEIANLFPRMIRRAEELRALPAQEPVPTNVQNYLEEASKCYIYGRFIPCLIVCRSAIDFALRERLTNLLMRNVNGDLSAIIELARTAFSPSLKKTLDDADDVRLKANQAVHKSKSRPEPEICKQMFIKTRGILRELYTPVTD